MNTKMQYFKILTEEKSLKKAADRVFISVQAFSEQMKNLEAQYGVTLFIRKPYFQLTEAGEALLNMVNNMIVLEHSFEAQLQDIKKESRRRLRFGIPAVRVRDCLHRTMLNFCQKYPEVLVEVVEGGTVDLMRKLEEGQVDLVFGVDAIAGQNIVQIQIYDEELYLIGSQEYLKERHLPTDNRGEVSPLSLGYVGLIIPREGSTAVAKFLAFCREKNFQLDIRIINMNYDLNLELAANGIGATLIPGLYLSRITAFNSRQPENPLCILKISGLASPSRLSLNYHKKLYKADFIKDFLDMFQENLYAHIDETILCLADRNIEMDI